MKPIVITGFDPAGDELRQSILQETTRLIAGVNISRRDVLRLPGDHVAVTITPEWLDHGHASFQLELSCYLFSLAHVNMSTIQVSAQPEDLTLPPPPPVRFSWLGTCVLGPLDAGIDYTLAASLVSPPSARDEGWRATDSGDETRECLAALSRVRFKSFRGTTSRVGTTTVTVTSYQATPNNGECEIRVQCQGGYGVEWGSVGFMIEGIQSGEIYGPKWLSSAGEVEFRVPARETEEFCVLVPTSEVLLGTAGQMIARAAGQESESPDKQARFAYEVTSNDNLVTAVAWLDSGGVITIQVETRERALQNGTAYVEFRSADGRVLEEGRMVLDLERRDDNGVLIYWGTWMKKASLPVDTTMRVVAFPRRPDPADSTGQGQ